MRRIVVLLALAGIAACGGDSTDTVSPTPRGVEGTYQLTTVNDHLMPLLLSQDDTTKLELLDGFVTLRTDGSFLDVIRLRRTTPSGVAVQGDTISGTFVHLNATLLFQPSDQSGNYFMDVTDDKTLTESDPGIVIVYRR